MVGYGENIDVRRALAEPLRRIAHNAGYEADEVQIVEDLPLGARVDAGVIDPLKVARAALGSAASIAALVVTTETAIVEQVYGNPGAIVAPGFGDLAECMIRPSNTYWEAVVIFIVLKFEVVREHRESWLSITKEFTAATRVGQPVVRMVTQCGRSLGIRSGGGLPGPGSRRRACAITAFHRRAGGGDGGVADRVGRRPPRPGLADRGWKRRTSPAPLLPARCAASTGLWTSTGDGSQSA